MKIKLYTEENVRNSIFLQMDIFDSILSVDLDDVDILYEYVLNNEPITYKHNGIISSIYSLEYRNIIRRDGSISFFNIIQLTKLSEYETEIRIVSANINNFDDYEELLVLNNEESNFIINALLSLINVILFYDNINDLYMKLPEGCSNYYIELEC